MSLMLSTPISTSSSTALAWIVKGGVKADHRGGVKIDQRNW
jgi:hypothetical protein